MAADPTTLPPQPQDPVAPGHPRRWRSRFETLWAKLITITLLTTLATLFLLLLPVGWILDKSFSALENETVARDIRRAENEFQDALNALGDQAFDYAVWDDTYNYMKAPDARYIESNYGDTTFIENRLNVILLLDTQGRLVYGNAFNLNTRQEAPLPDLGEFIAANDLLVRYPETTPGMTGLLILDDSPMVIAAYPILTSEQQGPSRGTLFMGRYLTPSEIDRLGQSTQLAITFRQDDDPRMEPDIQAARKALLDHHSPQPYITSLSETQIAGYLPIYDLFKRPAGIFRITLDRDIYQRGRISLMYLSVAIIIAALILSGVILFLQERLVLSRINQLREGVNQISEWGATGNFSLRLETPGHDELSRLTDTINAMLDTLEGYQRELLSQKRLFEDLVAVARATVERPTLTETLQNALDVARTLTNAERDSLFLLDENGIVTRSILAHAEDRPAQIKELIGQAMGTGLAGWVVRHGQPALVHDTDQDERWVPIPNVPYTRSALAVPIFTGERVSGILTLMHPQPGHFRIEDMQLMQAAADQMALAIHNAQIYEEQRILAQRQSILFQVLRTVGDHLNPGSVAHVAVETVAALTGWPSVSVLLTDDAATRLTLHAAAGTQEVASDFQIPITEGIVGRAFREAGTQYLPDVRTDPVYISISSQSPQGSELAVPLRRGKRLLGVLNIESTRMQAFNADDIQMAESLADTIALALDNARTHSEIRQYAANLNIVYALAWMISQSLVVEEMLQRALQTMISSLGFEAGIIALADPLTGQVETTVQAGPPELLARQLPPETREDALCSYVHRRRTPLVIGDLEKQAGIIRTLNMEVPEVLERIRSWGMRAYVCTPLMHQQQSLGAFCLFTHQPRTFSAEDLALQMSIGQQIAAAVTNARLFQAVTDERRRLQALIETSRDGIIFVGMNQGALVINAAALKLLHLPGTPEDWIHKPIQEFLLRLHQQSANAAQMAIEELHPLHPGHNQSTEGECEIAGRTLSWLNLPVQTGTDALGRLLMFRDITQERLLERMRQDLIHTMVHDLRTPLTGIVGAIRLLETNPNHNLTPGQLQLIEIANSSTQRMLCLVNAILDIYRLENGQMPLAWSTLALPEMAFNILETQSALAEEQQVRLENVIPEDLPAVKGDSGLIRRVLENLIANALKFTPPQGTVRLSACLAQDPDRPPHVLISVSDTGTGIPAEIRDRLFQKFTTGQQTKRGSGLGLAFCKMVMEAHGERIWVEQTSSAGTTFTFSLPLADI